MRPDVSILIPTYQGYRQLEQCLPFIKLQRYAGNVDVLAVDSGSTDGTLELLRQFGVKIIQIPKSEFTHGYARNLLVQNATTPLVVFISQDILPLGTEWLDRLVELLDDPHVGAAHVRQLPRCRATPLETFFHNTLYPPTTHRFTWLPGEPMTLDRIFFSSVCYITRRELCVHYPFPEDLIMSEDQAFARTLLRNGYDTVYSAEPAVVYSHDYSLRQLFRREFDRAYSLIGITEDTLGSTTVSGLRYLLAEIEFLGREQHWKWIPYAGIYELTRVVARTLGRSAQHLPLGLRMRFSQQKGFWQRTTPNQSQLKPGLSTTSP